MNLVSQAPSSHATTYLKLSAINADTSPFLVNEQPTSLPANDVPDRARTSDSPSGYAVIIPTLNGGTRLRQLIGALTGQTTPPSVVMVIDSGSTDGALDDPLPAKVQVTQLRGPFNHGAVRNQGAALTSAAILVFMTQDAVPANDAMERLISPLLRGEAEAAYARQLPRPAASPLERFARHYNYPPTSHAKAQQVEVRRVFFSNACSAIKRSVFEELGGFPTHTIMNEDMLFARRLLDAGYRIRYVPDSGVEHSHDYSLRQTFERYFDIGVFLSQAERELGDVQLSGEGARYAAKLFTGLVRDRHYAWMPMAMAETLAKAVGVFLGKKHRYLPIAVKRTLSMHKAFWR